MYGLQFKADYQVEQETLRFFKNGPEGKGDVQTEIKDQTDEQEEKHILCKQCENKITQPDQRIEVAGAFEHTFLNPGGYVFRISCFQSADGCISFGVPTKDWTWFEGFEWQVAICNQCNAHLGWFYRSSEEQNFFGLIQDLLV
jgi:hypothetical protein